MSYGRWIIVSLLVTCITQSNKVEYGPYSTYITLSDNTTNVTPTTYIVISEATFKLRFANNIKITDDDLLNEDNDGFYILTEK